MASQPIAAALRGKRLPLVPRVDIAVMEEGQARWLAFLNTESDVLLHYRRSSSTTRSGR